MSFLSIKSQERARTRSQRLKEKFPPKEDPLAMKVQPVEPLIPDYVKSKCGEIFVSKPTNFILVCSTCKTEFDTMDSFGIHWQEENNCSEKNPEDLKPTAKVEIEEETLCIPATYVEVKCEIIEEPQPEVQPVDATDDSDDADFDFNEYGPSLEVEPLKRESLETKPLVLEPIEIEPLVVEPIVVEPLVIEPLVLEPLVIEPSEIKPQDKNDTLQKEKVGSAKKRKPSSRPSRRSKPMNIYESDESTPEDPDDDSWHEEDFKEKRTVKKKPKVEKVEDPDPEDNWPKEVVEDAAETTENKKRKGRPRLPVTETDLSCKICEKRFIDVRAYRKHIHKAPDDLKCRYCDKVSENSSEYFEHMKTHKGKRKFQCPLCPKAFRTHRSRQEHLAVHTGERPFKCNTCPKTFITKYALEWHTRMHLNQFQADFACEFCDKRYLALPTLVAHRRTHTGEKPFQCEKCGKSFSTNTILQNHRKRHAEKSLTCDTCGMAFHLKTDLREHYVKHTGARPHKCQICEKTFPRKGALRLHMDLHSTVNKYVCDLCGKSFKQNIGLYTHKKTH